MRSSLTAACAALAILALTAPACHHDVNPAAPAIGAITIDAEPDFLEAPWQISGPNGYRQDGSGDATLGSLHAGTYTVAWLEVAGYGTPAAATREVTADATARFTGRYQEVGLPFPESADQLMQNFQTMYETMDLAEFTKMMHPEHLTFLQEFTSSEFPTLGPTLDMTEEQRIHERMFAKADVTDPDGWLVPGLRTITFLTFARRDAWATSSPTDPIPNTEFALYDIVVRFDRGGVYVRLRPQGALKFYVTHRDSTVNGFTRPYYQLRGQEDLTGEWKAAAEEKVSWGSVKALFR